MDDVATKPVTEDDPVASTVHAHRRKIVARMAKVALILDEPEMRMASILSVNDMLFDGRQFPWFTMGPAQLAFESRDVAKLTLTLPIKLVAGTPEMLDAPPSEIDEGRLRAAILAVSVAHDWAHTIDREDRTAEIIAEYDRRP